MIPFSTLPETNISHPSWPGRRSFPVGPAYFQVLLLLVLGSVILQTVLGAMLVT